jgi:hypothetical protein
LRSLCHFQFLRSIRNSCTLFCMKPTFHKLDAQNLSKAIKILNSKDRDLADEARWIAEVGNQKPGPLTVREKKLLADLENGRCRMNMLELTVPKNSRAHDLSLLNKFFAEYPLIARMDELGAPPRLIPDPRLSASKRERVSAIQVFISLAAHGLLYRLRRCPGCWRWFQGPHKKQNCSLACRKLAFNSRPDQMKWRREYQKDYMRCRRLVDAWSDVPVGTPVTVRKDEGSEFLTKTRSAPWRLRENKGRHIPAIRVDGIADPCSLERVSKVTRTRDKSRNAARKDGGITAVRGQGE